MLNQALLLHRQGQLKEAAALYRNVLARDPKNAEALHLLGVLELQQGNASVAVEFIGQAIGNAPPKAVFFFNLALALQALHRHEPAVAALDRSLALRPHDVQALLQRGNALRTLRRLDEALASYARALAIEPGNIDALNGRGVALIETGGFDSALTVFDRLLKIKPDHAEALNNRGNALSGLRRLDEALANYAAAFACSPDYADAIYNHGLTLADMGRFAEAIQSYDRALAMQPDHIQAWNNRGVALYAMKRFDEALASYDRVLAISPNFLAAHANRGNAFSARKCFGEALAAYDCALAIQPDYDFVAGSRLFCRLSLCQWEGLGHEIARIGEAIAEGKRVSSPAILLATPLSSGVQMACAEIFAAAKFPTDDSLGPLAPRRRDGKIRLGYFSADFHDHATAQLMAGLFEQHDRACFEVVAFSFGPVTHDPMRQRLERAFDRFMAVESASDRDIATLSRQLGIDIAIDLKGFTEDNRMGIFALRAAPIQINYLGYAGTMGAPYIDYLVADSTVIPEDCRNDYREKIVVLPDSYQVNDAQRPISNRRFTRSEAGLPEDAFVFCCFNNSYKITPPIFDIWMRLLRKVDGSVLWLIGNSAGVEANLRKEAAARGVAPERLIFAERMAPAEHLARHRLADLMLDTLPYNAHTTASDALWAGLPVLTCPGNTFPGKVAASLLKAAGLSELIALDLISYESMALELATDRQRLLAIRANILARLRECPLFDTARFARVLEEAYTMIMDRYDSGRRPDHIVVRPRIASIQAMCGPSFLETGRSRRR